jgi:tetratricopeptide (TPR) repeat protein
VDIYRIGERARDEIVRAGPLHPLWWAECVPPAFRSEYEELVVEPAQRSGGALVRADGTVAPWVEALAGFFDEDIRPFARLLSWELAHFDRYSAAAPLCEAVHVMHPDDVEACLSYARCVAALERWPEVEVSVSSTLAMAAGEPQGLAELHYLRGVALGQLGRRDDALRDLEWARARAEPGSELQAAADAEARSLGVRKPAQRLP